MPRTVLTALIQYWLAEAHEAAFLSAYMGPCTWLCQWYKHGLGHTALHSLVSCDTQAFFVPVAIFSSLGLGRVSER